MISAQCFYGFLRHAATPTEEQMSAVALSNNALRETELDILGVEWEGLRLTGCHTERPLGTMQLNRATCLDRCNVEEKVFLQPTRGGGCCLTNPRAAQKTFHPLANKVVGFAAWRYIFVLPSQPDSSDQT